MSEWVDAIVLGGGVAGLTAAYRLRDMNVQVIERSSKIGGRTLSERLKNGSWANYAAQYLSRDKVTMLALCEELGVETIHCPFEEADIRGLDGLPASEAADIEFVRRRIAVEQLRPRDPASVELDQVSFAEWLGDDAPYHVLSHFDHWCSSLMCVSSAETSLYGALMLWGEQRWSAFTAESVPMSNHGDVVIAGGTSELSEALAAAGQASIQTNSEVTAVRPINGGYEVHYYSETESVLKAPYIICALPAPVALAVLLELPPWKRSALGQIRYGRFVSTPIAVTPRMVKGSNINLTRSRPRQIYNTNNFALKTPGDLAEDGGCFHSYVYDCHARQIWNDPDDMTKTGVARALLDHHPHLEDRIEWVGIKRWKYGLPAYSLGRMGIQSLVEAPVGGIHFCGDYVLRSNTDGAARSAEYVATTILADN